MIPFKGYSVKRYDATGAGRWVNSKFKHPINPMKISVDRKGRPYMLDLHGNVYSMTGSKWISHPGQQASDIGVGIDNSVWHLSIYGELLKTKLYTCKIALKASAISIFVYKDKSTLKAATILDQMVDGANNACYDSDDVISFYKKLDDNKVEMKVDGIESKMIT
jgi:hypothetical protein